MKTKVLLLALLSGFVFSVSAQEFKPQVGFSNEAGYKTNFKKNKAGDNWFIPIAVARVFYLVIRTVKPILRIV